MTMKWNKKIILVVPLIILTIILFKVGSFNSIKISKVEVDTQKSIWNNIVKKEQIGGFSHDVGYTYDNWGWGLFLEYDIEELVNYEKHNKQLLLIKSFQNYLRTNLLGKATIFDSEDKMVIELLKLDEKDFLKVILDSYFGNQDLLKFIKNYLPSDNKVEELKSTNPDEYKILNDFYHAFYRDYFPIFNFLVTNNSDEDIVFESAFIEFKNIIVYSQDDSSSDSSSFDTPATYNWYFDIYRDTQFNNWYQNLQTFPGSGLTYNIHKVFNPGDEMHFVYRKKVISDKLSLKPQQIIPANETIRFQAKLIHNNGMPCKIRFNFIYGDNKVIKSNWYTFSQTSRQYH